MIESTIITLSDSGLEAAARYIAPQLKQYALENLADKGVTAEYPLLQNYHGFIKTRLPQIGEWAAAQRWGNIDLERSVQAELVSVHGDLTDQVHTHEHARAYCLVVGAAEGFEDPCGAYAFLRDHWKPVSRMDEVRIPPGTPHGFTVKPGGVLYFISVQSPPIVGDGHDDYHPVKDVPLLP